MGKIIELKKVNKWFDKFQVLKDIDLNVDKGEIVSLIGPSGSGKSSLLKMLVGLLIPKSGKIFLNKTAIFIFIIKVTNFCRIRNFI